LTPTEIGRLAGGDQPETYTSTQTLDNDLQINGSLTLSSGRLDVSDDDYSLNLGGDFLNIGGVFNARGGEVVLGAGDQLIHSSQTFYDLTKNVTTAAALVFGKDSTTTVSNLLTLNGAPDELLSLRSSTPGTPWLLDPA